MTKYTIGLDYGTNSVRAIIVSTRSGMAVGEHVWTYEHGQNGVILTGDPNLARQHPADYLKGAEVTVTQAIRQAMKTRSKFDPANVIGIGVDTTGSTPMPADKDGRPLALQKQWGSNPAAMAWLWKDHTGISEAEEITRLAREHRPHYLAKCGGTYSSEWFFSKVLHCRRTSPDVFDAAYTWVELADWIPATLTGTEHPEKFTACVCAAGHKAMYSDEWGGYPDAEFLGMLDPRLAELRGRLQQQARAIDETVGHLSDEWATRTGLTPGIPVTVGAFDAHLGAVGAGIRPGTLVKVLGTSGCDMMVHPGEEPIADIPGLCGIVKGSILPGYWGLEAGQSAVGDLYNWLVNVICPGGKKAGSHERLTAAAAKLRPGQSGLLALDWNHGNRTVLVDQRLTGLLLGQTLHTTPPEVYRALVEATAFGALTIIERFEEYGVPVRDIVACGGIAGKNPMVLQIYAEVTHRPIRLSKSSQTCALGAAIAAAAAAGSDVGGHDSIAQAQAAMSGLKKKVYEPKPENVKVYQRLYRLYRQLHDCFGMTTWQGDCSNVMKELIEIRDRTRGQTRETS